MTSFNNVLLIEDNPGDARLVTEYLAERFGTECKVRQVQTLSAGIHALRQHEVDVVLLDLGLPDSTGLEAFLTIHATAPSTPVVILTGEDDDDKALEALRIGAEDYLAKQQADSVTLIRAMRHAVQRKQLNDQLRASEAKYKALVETAEEGILQLSRSGELKYLNRRAAELLGISGDLTQEQVVLGRRLHTWVAPVDRISANRLLRTPAAERSSCELQLLRDDLSPCYVVAAAGGIDPREGEISDLVVLLTDITGRKLAEDELASLKDDLELRVTMRTADLQTANVELQAVNRALAHDLRNPLNGIIGLTGLVRRDAADTLPEHMQRRLQLVEKTALDMNELISGLLSLGALGRQTLGRESLDLSALVTTIAQRLTEAAPEREATFKVQPDVRALGDRVLVANVLQNLLHNAWKYSSKDSHAVIEFRAELGQDGIWVYSVTDNGVGFDPREASALFEPYSRLSSSKGIEGHGLGLAGVQRIVQRHGGRIWATSELGSSATFFFTLGNSSQP